MSRYYYQFTYKETEEQKVKKWTWVQDGGLGK